MDATALAILALATLAVALAPAAVDVVAAASVDATDPGALCIIGCRRDCKIFVHCPTQNTGVPG